MRICPVCEGLTSTDVARCGSCDVPLVRTSEVAWIHREGEDVGGSPWLGVVLGGKYRITGVLGKGGMGTVFRAVHELSLSTVAVKVLHQRFARYAQFKESLLEEARKASLLRSEHAARVVDVGETPEGSVFVAMELALGETLDVWLRRSGRLSHWVVSELLIQLSDALEDASSRGVVHRDLSPRNIMIEARDDGFLAKILDFGIAARGDKAVDGSSESGAGWVHPPYTAPEILRNEDHDGRADLFSLGVLAVECLTGEPPFSRDAAATLDDRIRAVLEDSPRIAMGRHVPRALGRVLARLLEKDPADRPASAREVRDAVESLRRPQRIWFQVASVLAFIAGSTALLTSIATSGAGDPFLQSDSSAALLLSERRSPAEIAQNIRVEDVERVAFVARGIEPGGLVARGYDGAELFFEYELGGRIVDRRLELDASRDLSWKAVLDACVKRRRPVHIDFQDRASQRVIAHAHVFLDRSTPSIDVREMPNRFALNSRFVATVKDDASRVRLKFELLESDRVIASHATSVGEERDVDLPIGRLLVAAPGSSLDERRNATLRCRLEDPSGRTAEWIRRFERADLQVPKIARLVGASGSSPISVDAGLARLVVGLERPEASIRRLHVGARRNGVVQKREFGSDSFDVIGTAVHFTWEHGPSIAEEIEYTVEVEDECGNRSEPISQTLRFVNLELNAKFALRATDRPVVPQLARLERGSDADRWLLRVPTNTPVALAYSCGASWLPQPRVDGAGRGEVELGEIDISVKSPTAGRCLLEIPGLSAGTQAAILVRHLRADAPLLEPLKTVTRLDVRVIPDAPVVEVPRQLVAEQFASELRIASMIAIRDGRVRVAVELDPAPSALAGLRGRLWYEQGGRWFAATPQLRPIGSSAEFARLDAPLLDGANRIAVQLEDSLGRGPRNKVGEPIVDLGSAQGVVVADFWHATDIASVASVSVEINRDVTLSIPDSAPLPLGSRTTLVSGQTSFPGTLSVARDGAREHRFVLPFSFVREVCAWTSLGADDFAKSEPRTVDFRIRTRAGDRGCRVRFEPSRSLLRGLRLSDLETRFRPLESLELVPFLAPAGGTEVRLGPPAGVKVRGSVQLEPPVAVSGLRDVFLGAHEVTRREWLMFVKDVLARLEAGTIDPGDIAHFEDPLGKQRFTRAGLAPDLSVFGDTNLDAVVKLDPNRPITGVDYYQALAFCRWLGLVSFGDADLFRLPFGAELEWAALGDRAQSDRLLGIARAVDETDVAWRTRFRAFRDAATSGRRLDASRWPISSYECRVVGDFARAWDDTRAFGIEFGVREWVEDLPVIGSEPSYRLIFEIHDRQVEYAARRRTESTLRPPRTRALATGQLRGASWGEPELSGRDPAADLVDVRGRRRADGLLGVKRIHYLRRDGRGLQAGTRAPILRVAGFRIAGGDEFIRLVRARQR